MSIPLATLEGISMNRYAPTNRRRAVVARQLATIQRAHVLYGLDGDTETLGGWWTDAKRATSRVGSSILGATIKSGIPGISQIAAGMRAGGRIAEETGVLPSILRTGSASTGTVPVTETVAPVSGQFPSWLPWAVLATVGVFVVAKR